MTEGIKAIIYPVRDLAKAKTLYGMILGVEPDMDEPYYVGFNVGDQDVGLDPNGHGQGMTGPVVYWQVDDIERSVKALLEAGAEVHQEVKDVGGGKLIASVKDADVNVIGLLQSPWCMRGESIPPPKNPRGEDPTYLLSPVGWVRSPLTDRTAAPKQGDEGAPLARVVFRPGFREAARDLREGTEVLVLTWLHQGRRDVLSVHPRGDTNRTREGVFSTRSPDRPNPIGLHTVVIETVEENAIKVHGLEAIDGTPVLDIKPVLGRPDQR